MDAIFPIAMRWLHLASVIVLVGGIFYARVAVGDMAARFKTLAYVAIGAILVSGFYNFLSKTHLSPNYQMWFGIKVLLALHVFAVTILYRGPSGTEAPKTRLLTGAIISSAVIVGIAGYLRWITQ